MSAVSDGDLCSASVRHENNTEISTNREICTSPIGHAAIFMSVTVQIKGRI